MLEEGGQSGTSSQRWYHRFWAFTGPEGLTKVQVKHSWCKGSEAIESLDVI